ncbi:MAG: flagellar motor protein MotA, partial [Roseococcus sp.]
WRGGRWGGGGGWVGSFRNSWGVAPARPEPRLLAPLAALLAARRSERLALSAGGLRSVLDGIVARLDETRELSRYMTGLLIFLGLLGTFWGLLLTIAAVAEVIGAMRLSGGEAMELFDQLKAGLAEPLRGMGVAFSSSLFGLAGALVLGFLDLTAGQAQSRFATELEDWLAGHALLSGGLSEGGAGELAPLLDQLGAAVESVQAALEQGGGPASLALLADRMSVLAEQARATQYLLGRVAEQQAQILQREEERRQEMQQLLRALARRDG